VFEEGAELPTEQDPELAVVLVPSDGAGSDGPSGEPPEDVWVFPFDRPLPPGEGDNQALSVNTTDDSVTYDVAFALVWADGDEVLNVNEAHAYASCSDCTAVAVAFQVVLIMDDAEVVVPQNLAVAANYDCYRCFTAAIASQLVLSVSAEPGQDDLLALAAVWNRLQRLGSTITSYSLTEIAAQLEAFKAEIAAILTDPPPATSTPSPSTPTPTAPDEQLSDSPSASPSPSTEATTTAPTPEDTTSSSPTEEATPGTESPTPTESATDSTTPSASTSP
jgi:putative peptide zinc metalloprotease protein